MSKLIDIITIGSYTLQLHIHHINQPEDHFHFEFKSQWSDAKDPTYERVLFATTVSRKQLTKIASVINLALAKTRSAE